MKIKLSIESEDPELNGDLALETDEKELIILILSGYLDKIKESKYIVGSDSELNTKVYGKQNENGSIEITKIEQDEPKVEFSIVDANNKHVSGWKMIVTAIPEEHADFMKKYIEKALKFYWKYKIDTKNPLYFTIENVLAAYGLNDPRLFSVEQYQNIIMDLEKLISKPVTVDKFKPVLFDHSTPIGSKGATMEGRMEREAEYPVWEQEFDRAFGPILSNSHVLRSQLKKFIARLLAKPMFTHDEYHVVLTSTPDPKKYNEVTGQGLTDDDVFVMMSGLRRKMFNILNPNKEATDEERV